MDTLRALAFLQDTADAHAEIVEFRFEQRRAVGRVLADEIAVAARVPSANARIELALRYVR
jgi:hypothetical protein